MSSLYKNIFLFAFLFNIIKGIKIEGRIEVQEPTADRLKSITVSLIWGNQMSYITEEGNFYFDIKEPGYYLIQVNDDLYEYETMFLDIREDEIKAYEYNYRYGKGSKHKYPFIIRSVNKNIFGEQKTQSFKSILKSPYVIMILFGSLMFLCMKMVPQEELQAQQEQMKKQFKGYKGFF